MIEYKGYIGAVDFDPEIDLFHGTVINTHDVITFYGASVTELRQEMQKSIEGYLEFCKEQEKTPEKPFSGKFTVQMNPETSDLRRTITHILEHKQDLAGANEATTQQYVILPILRALGWNDANLASMEVLPEYVVKGVKDGIVDYALKVEKKHALFIECKKWNESLEKHEDQITNYAFKAGVRLVGLTNGKIWRFYFSWVEGTSVSDRILCVVDIEDQESAVSGLEKYLLKSNVASGEAELDAEIALEEKEKVDRFKPNPISSRTDWVNDRSRETISEGKIKWTFPISPTELRRARTDAGVSTKTISDACGYAHNVNPSMWENGHRNIPPKHHRTVWSLIFPNKPFPS